MLALLLLLPISKGDDGGAVGPLFKVTSGRQFCEVTYGGLCVSDGRNSYGPDEACTIEALYDVQVSAVEYNLAPGGDTCADGTDHLLLMGQDPKCFAPHLRLPVRGGQVIRWSTGGGERRRGGERLAAFQGREVVLVEVQTFFVDREDVPEGHRRGRRDQRAAGDAVRAAPRKRRGGVFSLER